jgi:uncharacterized membrane protein YoaK (UPF0700 family)
MRTRRADQIVLLVCIAVTSFIVGIVARSTIARDRWDQGIWLYRVLLQVVAIVVGYLAGLCLVKYLHHRAFVRERQRGAADDPKGDAGN